MPGEMQIDRSRRSGSCSQLPLPDGWVDTADGGAGGTDGCSSSFCASSTSESVTSSHSFSSAKATACGNYIEHRVSKMDTLAGVAIKYGVEVADIRRLNALVTDRQMFAHKSIKIPLPGRHPPSPIMTNGSSCNGNMVNGFSSDNADAAQPAALGDENGEIDRQRSEKSIRRRQKVDVDSPCKATELLSEEEDGTLPGRTGKGTAPRTKSGSRTDLDSSFLSATSTGESFIANGFLSVRKSSSTSDLQESDNGSSIRPTSKWSLKPDIIAKPLFDGLPKPMAAWRSKAALD
ncbi:hypothetical protein Taro_017082 [Colocasia esculenta]|uniref:LysM domain-containing protein n=1 Tax=Colocasia esculenta TaxID=4460 RepID=A0A843UUY0_COLES|nr:hypothetical protein [Colocasia esculenta]